MAENGDQEQDGQDFTFSQDLEENDRLVTEADLLDGAPEQEAEEEAGEEGANVTEDADAEGETGVEDPELEAIKQRVREMEEEAEKLKEMQTEVEKQMKMSSPPGITSPVSMEDKIEVDSRSVYVGNVDYGATAEELEAHFHGCGSINRVTILCDKFTGHPKGFAYVEFADKDSISTAQALDESLFRGRQIKVNPKRTNRPGISSTDRGAPRGRGYGRRGRGGYYGYSPRPRGRFRPRRSAWYSPY